MNCKSSAKIVGIVIITVFVVAAKSLFYTGRCSRNKRVRTRVQESTNKRTIACTFCEKNTLIYLIYRFVRAVMHCSHWLRRRGTVTRHRMHAGACDEAGSSNMKRQRLQSRLQKGAAGCILRFIPSGRRTRTRLSLFAQGRFTQARLGRRPSR